ncbi:MAG: GIY-YIG nuclease family protein [Sphingobacteriaceae bacterium]
MFSVYVKYSKSYQLKYTGYSEDIERRLFEHNNGLLGRYTKNKGPWELIYKVDFATRSEAIAHEKYLKSGKGLDFIKAKFGI